MISQVVFFGRDSKESPQKRAMKLRLQAKFHNKNKCNSKIMMQSKLEESAKLYELPMASKVTIFLFLYFFPTYTRVNVCDEVFFGTLFCNMLSKIV